MKKSIGLMGMLAATHLMMGASAQKYSPEAQESAERKAKIREKYRSDKDVPQVVPKNPDVVIPKGHQLFVVDGVEIYALNMKNAIKKVKKL